jgi:predicted ATPase/DNA-binding SARP family transcriptional activator
MTSVTPAGTSGAPQPVLTATDLPLQLTTFIGRAGEVEEIRGLIRAGRLLTLTGAGGSGKTRLALEAATGLESEVARVGWVELAGLSEPALVAQQVAEQLGVQQEGAQPALQTLLATLRDARLLLVLDNCEHLVDACAHLVEALLRGCPDLKILATSREPLGIGGERAWLVPSLALPSAEEADVLEVVERTDATRLFIERARETLPGFEPTASNAAAIAEICRRLDGLPLAIELAAARVRVLPPEQIRERLNDVFRLLNSGSRTALPRQQTLRATIDWSYALLGAEEQLLLGRLSVFSGSFSLEATEAVCGGDGIEDTDVLDLIARLVERSLVTMRETDGTARYSLLETVRQYAAARLEEGGIAVGARAAHARHFAGLLAAAEPHLVTRERRQWLATIQTDLDNVRQALAWSRAEDPALHLRMAGMLCWFWFSTGYWSEGRRWAEGALELPGCSAPTRDRAAALFAGAVIACLQAETGLAERWLGEAVEISRAEGDERLAAYALNYLGMALIQQGRLDGEEPTREALEWFRANRDLYGLRLSLLLLGSLYNALGKPDEGAAFMAEAVEVAREFGLPRELGIALQMLGSSRLLQGDLASARVLFHDSLAALRLDPQHLFLARGMEMLGAVAGETGEPEAAVRLIAAGAAVRRRIGARLFHTDQVLQERRLGALRELLGPARFERLFEEGERPGLEQAIHIALTWAELGAVQSPADGPGEAPSAVSGGTSSGVPLTSPAPAPTGTGATPVPDLEVWALGPLYVATRGVEIDAAGWKSARPRELLLFLLCHPRGRTREQVGLVFWPDASAPQVKNSFHVLLHRLRRAVDDADLVVLDGDRYRINPERDVRFDAALFEDRITAALSIADAPVAMEALKAALELYRGDFLGEEVVGDWHLEMHDRLRRCYVDGLSRLADLQIAAGEIAPAAATLEALVEKEDLREEAHRKLMECYVTLEQRDRALRHYDRLVTLLREELDATPEPQTVELAERIRTPVPSPPLS